MENNGPVSFSHLLHLLPLKQLHSHTHTHSPLLKLKELILTYHCVSVSANSITAVLPNSDNTAGSVLKHMGHLRKNSLKSKAKNRPFSLESKQRKRVKKGLED